MPDAVMAATLPPTLPLLEAPIAVIDVETTGLSPRHGDRIVELAVLRAEPDGRVAEWSSLVNPGRPISPAAGAVNGIRDIDLVDAPPFVELIVDLAEWVAGAVVVAHNAPFDLGFIAAEHQRVGAPMIEAPIIDTLVLARRWFRFPSNSLGDVARALGVRGGRAHRAAGDAHTTYHVLRRMADDLAPRGIVTLDDYLRGHGPGGKVGPDGLPRIDEPLATAIRDRRTVAIRYSRQGQTSERLVDPIAVQGGQLVAFCRLRQAQRTFQLNRIVAAWWPEG